MIGFKPRLAVWKFSSCDGCQLSILDCERELIAASQLVEFTFFPEASRKMAPGPYDISLVEGSITTPEEAERIHQIRENSKILVAIGACATGGGLQALRNFANLADYQNIVYAHPEYLKSLDTSTPIEDHVQVDYELRGCPISKKELINALIKYVHGGRLAPKEESLCIECKAKGVNCLMVSQNQPCLGPITQAGCEALCPSFNRACFGCFGPKKEANIDSLAEHFQTQLGLSKTDVLHLLRSYYAAKEPLASKSVDYE